HACAGLDLHVAPGLAFPPPFTTTTGVAFPHVRTTAAPDEVYRAGDATGADWRTVTLRAVKGPATGEVTLHATGGCAAGAPTTWADGAVYLRQLHVATTGTAGGDGSPARPFDTIVRAAAVARPGDDIVVHAG